MSGPIYSVLFTAFICLLSLGIGWILDPWIRKHRLSKEGKVKAVRAFQLWCLFTLALIYLDIREKTNIPAFHCRTRNNNPNETIHCRFTLEGAPRVLEVHYQVVNHENVLKKCETLFRLGDVERPSPDTLAMAPLESRKVSTSFPYPTSETTLELSLVCKKAQ